MHKGKSSAGLKTITEMKTILEEMDADLVFLQEVQGGKQSENIPDQFEYLADSLWPHFSYGRNAIYSGGHHGNAILSKYPFSFTENIKLNTSWNFSRGLVHGILHPNFFPNPIHVICMHLGMRETERQKQVQILGDRIAQHIPANAPLIIAGDSNDWLGKMQHTFSQKFHLQESYQVLHGHHARTFPSIFPVLPLDRIYVRGLKIMNVTVLKDKMWRKLSDHLPLYAELKYDEKIKN